MIRVQRTLRLLRAKEHFMKTIFTSIAAAGTLVALCMAQPNPSYTVTDLGALGTGNNSSGFQINNAGWIAGSSNQTPTGPQVAFLWYGGKTLVSLWELSAARVVRRATAERTGPMRVGRRRSGLRLLRWMR